MAIMSSKPKPTSQILQDSSLRPGWARAIRFLITALIGGLLLGLSGLVLTGTMIAVVIVTPLLLLFTPITIPSVAAVALVTTGLMFSGGCLVAALAAVAWIYHYATGKHLVAVDLLYYLKTFGSKDRDVKERIQEREKVHMLQ